METQAKKLKSIDNVKGGFTIIELIVSVALFLIVTTISSGAFLALVDANHKSEQLRTVTDNLSFIIEDMTRELRSGRQYHCGNSGTLTAPQDCPAGDSFLRFQSAYVQGVEYYLSNGQVFKQWGIGGPSPTTAPMSDQSITITDLKFYVEGSTGGPPLIQPYVLLHIKGTINGVRTQTDINVQTIISQRF